MSTPSAPPEWAARAASRVVCPAPHPMSRTSSWDWTPQAWRSTSLCRRSSASYAVTGSSYSSACRMLAASGDMVLTIRSRSSMVANSTTILPLLRPNSTLTLVSNTSDNRSAR